MKFSSVVLLATAVAANNVWDPYSTTELVTRAYATRTITSVETVDTVIKETKDNTVTTYERSTLETVYKSTIEDQS